MNTLFFLVVFASLTLFYTILGLLASKKVSSNVDYFLAGRDLGLMPLALTLIATQLGGAMLLGTSENAYLYGLYGILYTAGIALGFLMLSMGIASRLQSLNVSTTAEIFETHYKSIFLKHVASFLSIVTLCGILIGQVVGSRSIIDSLNLGIGNELLFILFWLFVILYTIVGGLHAVVVADGLQVLVIILVFTGIFIYSLLYGPAFDWSNLNELQSTYFGTMPISLNMIVATLCMPAFFALIEQDLAQRFFAARTKRIATLAAITSCLFMIAFSLIPIYFGMQAKILGLSLPHDKSPLVPVVEYLTNEFVVALCLCAIIAAITSTADSLLCAISSNIAQDFNFSWFGSTNALSRSKWITLFVGAIALAGSYFVPQNIITIMIDSYLISVSCLLVPLLFVYFDFPRSKNAAVACVLAGAIGVGILPFLQTDAPKVLLPLILSLCAYIATLMIEKYKSA